MTFYYQAKKAFTFPYRQIQRHRYRNQPKPFTHILEALNYSRAIIKFLGENGTAQLDSTQGLHENSTVVDIGGFNGEWAKKIHDQCPCNMLIFEPIKNYAAKISSTFKYAKNVKVFNYGLAAKDATEPIFLRGPGSSLYEGAPNCSAENCEIISLFDIKEQFNKLDLGDIDLLKINIEGAEYALLDRMLTQNLVTRCREIRVQFHEWYPGAHQKRRQIRKELQKTHRQNWNYPFVWESWIKR